MTRFFKFFLLLISSIVIFSCKDEEETAQEVILPFADVYRTDIEKIETYLKTHDFNPVDETFSIVPAGSAASLWGSNLNVPKSSLLFKIVSIDGIDYKCYYVSIREGVKDKPTAVDQVVTGYKGQLLDANSTIFDQNSSFDARLAGGGLIRGWQEMFPLFKSGTGINLVTGLNNDDFGKAIFFLPSALAYYNQVKGSIPAYSPLVFSIKLKEVRYVDNEGDDIKSVFEDLNGDGNPFNDDSDADGVPNFGDIDDDADYLPTKTEVQRPKRDQYTGEILVDASGNIIYSGFYPYNGATVDDPATANIDERQGIPRKFTGPLRDPSSPESATNRRRPQQADYTDPSRLRRHMDASSKFPYE